MANSRLILITRIYTIIYSVQKEKKCAAGEYLPPIISVFCRYINKIWCYFNSEIMSWKRI